MPRTVNGLFAKPSSAGLRRARAAAAIAATLFVTGLPGLAALEPDLDPGWPREKTTTDGTRIVLYQPQVDSWELYVELDAHVAAEIFTPGASAGVPAAMRIKASTTTDFSTRTVVIYDAKLIDVTFPSADEATAAALTSVLASTIPVAPVKISLDRILAHFEAPASGQDDGMPVPETPPVRETAVKPDPPPIILSTRPAQLVMFDGQAIFTPVAGTGLMAALNTNWDVLEDKKRERYYLLLDDGWLYAEEPAGPWKPAGKLPKDFRRLPATAEWEEVRKHVPGRDIERDEMPRIYVSFRPTELIVTDGAPEPEPIGETGVFWVTNTESDLFFVPRAVVDSDRPEAATEVTAASSSGTFYYLVSGRWFRTVEESSETWEFASDDLPAGFAAIPEDHPRGRVRVSVPGTSEAKEAVLLAQVPRTAEVRRDEVEMSVAYDGKPKFVQIEGTAVSYAANTKFDVFHVGTRYYTCHEAIWFVADSPDGPWLVADDVPSALYDIPPSSPKHHVTYVHVYDSTPDVVVTGYTSGYWGVYVSWGCVVYGTGWYYPPYVYWGPYSYPYYYAYPYSYGVAAWYNPYTGLYGRGAYAYGPYGGYGWGRSYNPQTGTYSRGVAAYGPYQAGYAREAYNPRTDTYAATYQRANPYESWGESVVQRGDDWIHTGHYANEEGAIAGFETSEGGKGIAGRSDEGRQGFVAKDGDNNLYAGRDGNVYRRDDEGGWSKYGDGGWESAERPALTDEQKGQARERASEAGVDRDQVAQRAGEARDARAAGERGGASATERDRDAAGRTAGDSGRRSGDAGRRDSGSGATARDRSSSGSSGGRSYGASPGSAGSRGGSGQTGRLDGDAYARSRGSSRSRDYGSYRSSGRSYGGRSYGGGSRGGGRGRRR